MNRSLLLVVCDFLLLSILALARFDVPEGATIAQDDQKVVSKEVIERISDGESYDDVVAELEATNETLLENLSSDKDDTSQSASTHYTDLTSDTSAEPNISTASGQPVMVGPDSLEHIEGHDVGKRNKPIYGPRRKHQSRRRSRR